MSKKKMLIIGVILIISITMVLAGLLYYQKISQNTLISPVVNKLSEKAEPTRSVEKMLTWNDPLGFVFDYPASVLIDPHDEDQENYAHLELKSDKNIGGIIIWSKDTNYQTLKNWAESEQITESGIVMDTEVDGVPAKKIRYKQPANKYETVFLYDDLLFIIETTNDPDNYWLTVNNGIISSFKQFPLEEPSVTDWQTGTTESGGEEIEEEVIE